MVKELNIGKLGAEAPFLAKEGTITITEDSGIGGSLKRPVHSAALKKGTKVALDGEMTVKAAGANDTVIGIVGNSGNWVNGVEPKTDYTQAAAITAGFLREFKIETKFRKILTVDAKASEGITAGMYVIDKPKVEKSASSGTTETTCMALSDQDSTTNRVIVGYL